jgi:hypothetical protein
MFSPRQTCFSLSRRRTHRPPSIPQARSLSSGSICLVQSAAANQRSVNYFSSAVSSPRGQQTRPAPILNYSQYLLCVSLLFQCVLRLPDDMLSGLGVLLANVLEKGRYVDQSYCLQLFQHLTTRF